MVVGLFSRRLALALVSGGVVAACGFAPLHAPTGGGRGGTGRVALDPVEGVAGFALRERLTERLGESEAPTHRLAVDLRLTHQAAAITTDDITTRYVLLGEAAYELLPIGGGAPLLAERVTGRTAYSAPASDTGTIFAARRAALAAEERVARMLADRITTRLALVLPGAEAAAR